MSFMKLPKFRGQFQFNYVYLIPIAIFVAKLFEVLLRVSNIEFSSSPIQNNGTWFVSNFIEWFGALYGILVTLVLVRVWEQFDEIDREFDREADTVKILYEDVLFFQGKNEVIGKDIITLLKSYVIHVLGNYPREVKQVSDRKSAGTEPPEPLRQQLIESVANSLIRMGNQMKPGKPDPVDHESLAEQKVDTQNTKPTGQSQEAVPEQTEINKEIIAGDLILREIRRKFKLLLRPEVMNEKVNEILVRELFQRLNELIDIRGDRIGMASQRLFDTLRFVVLVTSIVYVLPFYFVSVSPFPNGILDDLMIAGVTLLVIFIYLTIEDFDEPFSGTWQISDEPWRRLLGEMASPEREEELRNPSKQQPKKKSPTVQGGKLAAGKAKPNSRKRKPTLKEPLPGTPSPPKTP